MLFRSIRLQNAGSKSEGHYAFLVRDDDMSVVKLCQMCIRDRVESEAPGECVYSLRLDGRPATTAVQPRLKSESVLELSLIHISACNRRRPVAGSSYGTFWA